LTLTKTVSKINLETGLKTTDNS